VLAPGRGVALIIDLDHRHVGHKAVGGGSVPVVLAGLKEHSVAEPDDLDRAAATLTEAAPLGDVDGLPVGVGVPSRAGTGSEVDAACR
jgi:hypothetical protein